VNLQHQFGLCNLISPVFPIGPDEDMTFNATAIKPNGADVDIVLKLTTGGKLMAERLPQNQLDAGSKLFIDVSFYTGIPVALQY